MMEGMFLGMAGGCAVLLTKKAWALCRTSRQDSAMSRPSSPKVSRLLTICLAGAIQATRSLFNECKAEIEATRIAVEEVKAPASGKVVRIY